LYFDNNKILSNSLQRLLIIIITCNACELGIMAWLCPWLLHHDVPPVSYSNESFIFAEVFAYFLLNQLIAYLML
jgi:hypothetical protein